jgi:CHASE3 domain sensor protein
MLRIMTPFVGLVARVPARLQTKLLAAFLAIAALLIILGAVGLEALSNVNRRTEELIKLQRKIEAYRQVQHDTTSQLYSVATALLLGDEQTLSSTLRQINQFGYDVDRLEFVAKDEVELIEQFRRDYNRFIEVVTSSSFAPGRRPRQGRCRCANPRRSPIGWSASPISW